MGHPKQRGGDVMAIAEREITAVQAGEAILQVLLECGVEDIFSSPGSDWPAIWEALARRREEGNPLPRFVNCRHEELAVAMAMGYYRASGKLPVVVLHTGVGLMLIAGLRRSVETAAAGPAPGTPQHSIFG